MNWYPICEQVLYAITRFRSFCRSPVVAAKNAVSAPTHVITISVVGAYSNSGDDRNNRYTPAVTSVAAWIKADTGVGPSMASGSQVCNPN